MTPETLESERAQAQEETLSRLKRARDQLNTVIRAVREEQRCSDIVAQLAAVNSVLQRAGFSVTSSAIRDCVGNKEQTLEGVEAQFKELEKLFLSLS